MCHIMFFFSQTVLHTNIHCNNSLVWFKVSCFWTIINTEKLPRLLSDILLLPKVAMMLQLGRASMGRYYVSSCLLHTSPSSRSATVRIARLNFCACSLQATLLTAKFHLPAGQAAQVAAAVVSCWMPSGRPRTCPIQLWHVSVGNSRQGPPSCLTHQA